MKWDRRGRRREQGMKAQQEGAPVCFYTVAPAEASQGDARRDRILTFAAAFIFEEFGIVHVKRLTQLN